MTISLRLAPSRPPLHRVLIALGVLVGVLALAPIVAGVASVLFGQDGPRTAFASAAEGEYAVFASSSNTTDTIMVAPSTDPSHATVIASVDHLPGFFSRGAVSPDGTRLALVTVDAGTVTAPGASLLVVNLETGEIVRAATQLDYLQTPVWAPGSTAVVAVRGGDTGKVSLVQIEAAGAGETELQVFTPVLGVYPLSFDHEGRLVTVVIDGSGSTLYRDGEPLKHLSAGITRDWQLSPDGTQLAFIDASVEDGLEYLPRVVSLMPGFVEAQSLTLATGQALGTAWAPAASAPTFGVEPSLRSTGAALAQSLAGFDIPLAYSPTGESLVVERWSGASFSNAGDARFELITADNRAELPGASRFFGWAAR